LNARSGRTPDLTTFFGKLRTITTHSKMGQMDDAIAFLKAQDALNYAAAARLYDVQPTTLWRGFWVWRPLGQPHLLNTINCLI
jgi:hypothetical protein